MHAGLHARWLACTLACMHSLTHSQSHSLLHSFTHSPTNQSLTHAFFFFGSTGTEGCEFFSEMLRVNKTLKKLILSSNLVDDDGLRALSDGVGVNDTLETLVCFDNMRQSRSENMSLFFFPFPVCFSISSHTSHSFFYLICLFFPFFCFRRSSLLPTHLLMLAPCTLLRHCAATTQASVYSTFTTLTCLLVASNRLGRCCSLPHMDTDRQRVRERGRRETHT